jgi:hypothetical protein
MIVVGSLWFSGVLKFEGTCNWLKRHWEGDSKEKEQADQTQVRGRTPTFPQDRAKRQDTIPGVDRTPPALAERIGQSVFDYQRWTSFGGGLRHSERRSNKTHDPEG